MIDGALQRGMSRASLLKLGAAAAAVVVGGRSAAEALAGATATANAPAKAMPRARGPRHLRLATYVPLVGSTFLIHRPSSRPLPVTLVTATPLSDDHASFSLLFRGHPNAKLSQLTYRIDHPSLGEFQLFVVPVGRPGAGRHFEAIVNRISPAHG